jgi:MFS family permease
VFAYANGIGQIPAGWLADHIGRKILLAVGIVGVAAAGILVGLSSTFVALLVCLAIMGALGGGYHPASTPMISAAVEPSKRGRALGIHAIGGSSGFFVAPLISPFIAAAWGWRVAFFIMAGVTAAYGIFFLWHLRRQSGRNESQTVTSKAAQVEESFGPGRWRRLIAFMALVIAGGGLAGSVSPFLPLYFVDEFHLSKALAGSLTAIGSLAGLLMPYVGGYLSDRIGRTYIIVGTTLAGAVVIFLYGILPWGPGFIVAMAVFGMAMYLRLPVSEVYIIGLTSAKRRSTFYGMYYFATTETSAILAPLLGGFLINKYSYAESFRIVGIAVIAITLICAVFMWRNRD